ncbi:hypothetical protein NDU88_000757 [Pleurodeles waltl]|uniref:Uncharacterized protein n=1 Tax=Pleurodeles waltl TaxID=8319 RepID=A0AAV7SXB5_PLEWA|nr:hypothetical protein NDU88_000757 [Pleurodeles waltl]
MHGKKGTDVRTSSRTSYCLYDVRRRRVGDSDVLVDVQRLVRRFPSNAGAMGVFMRGSKKTPIHTASMPAPAAKGKKGAPAGKAKKGAPAGKAKKGAPAGKGKEAPPAAKSKEAPSAGKGKEAPPAAKSKEAPPAGKSKEASPAVRGKKGPPAAKGRKGPPAAKDNGKGTDAASRIDMEPGAGAISEQTTPDMAPHPLEWYRNFTHFQEWVLRRV